MSEEVKAVHREPHPFVGVSQITNPSFFGKTVAFVGKIDKAEDQTLVMKSATGKFNQ